MSEQLIQNPAEVRRLWSQARNATDRADAAIARAERLCRIDRGVRDGSYRDDGPELDASLDKLQAAIDAAKPPVDPDDDVEHGERWDGLG